MNPVAAILNSLILYRYSLILALACAAGICFFLACCSYADLDAQRSAAAALTAVLLSLPMSRLIYWYARPDNFFSIAQALTHSDSEAFALAGVPVGCALSALLLEKGSSRKKMLDCMSIAGCAGIALGRLGCFFTETNRGQIMVHLTALPWAYPVANTSGQPEFRFATFLFQAAFAAVLGLFLTAIFLRKRHRCGDITILFLLFYSASQIILDSTRYDSLYLRSNGFVSMVQVVSAVTLASVLILLSIRAVRMRGLRVWMIPLWISFAALLGGTGYMEYYVQRHGREAAFAYSIMGSCLTATALLGLLLWQVSRCNAKE